MSTVTTQSILNTIVIMLLYLPLTSCGTTQPSQYYMLTSITNNKTVSSASQSGSVKIGLGPVRLPKYLDRSPLVIRTAGAEVVINDLHRWAEPLEDNFTRIVAENLYALIGNIKVTLHPWRDRRDVDYQVIITLYQFDTDLNGNVVISSTWSILASQDEKELYSQRTTIHEQAVNNAYPALVDAQSKAAEQLSREIAAKLEELISRG